VQFQSIFRPGLFEGKTVIITGGGSGIGRCTAHELASLGANVAIVGRKIEKLEKVCSEIIEDGGSATPHVCDIRIEEQVIATIDRVLQTNGRIDGLVNNAGGQFIAPTADISTKGFEAVVRNNLTGGFIFMRETYTRWMRQNGGAIVNMIAEIWNGWPNYAHSGAARAGMLSLTESTASEWAHAGVRVNAVAPGAIASSGMNTYEAEYRARLVREMAAYIPAQRFGTESEVSAAIVFLLSPAAAFITGSFIRIDGGSPNARPVWTGPLPPAARSEIFSGFHRSIVPDVFLEANDPPPSSTSQETGKKEP